MREISRARLVVLAAVFFVSFSAILVRLSSTPAIALAAWRMGVSTVLMVPVLVVSRARGRDRGGVHGERYRIPLVILSGFFLAIHFAAWITSLSLTSVTHATVLVTLHPVVVILASAIFLREQVAPMALAGSLGAILGAGILAMGGSLTGITPTAAGNALALVGAVAVAGYLVLGRSVRQYTGAAEYNLLVYGTAALVLLIFAGIAGQSFGPYTIREFAIYLALALFCTILGHGLFNWALRQLPATEISLAVLLEPVFASFMAVLVFGEIPGPVSVAGAIIILGSLSMVLYYKRGR